MKRVKIRIYKTRTGRVPYIKWRDKLDINTAAIISQRVDRVVLGNFGDCDGTKVSADRGDIVWLECRPQKGERAAHLC